MDYRLLRTGYGGWRMEDRLLKTRYVGWRIGYGGWKMKVEDRQSRTGMENGVRIWRMEDGE